MRTVMVEYADDVDISSIPKGTEAAVNEVAGGTVVAIIDAIDPPESGIPDGPVGITITGIAEVTEPPV